VSLFQVLCLLFTPLFIIPALLALVIYAGYYRCRRRCRPWAGESDFFWEDPDELDFSSVKSAWTGLTSSTRLNPPSKSFGELLLRDPDSLKSLRTLLDEEVRAAFARLGNSLENPCFGPTAPPASISGTTVVVGEERIDIAEDLNHDF
jgi:hypothetical protein